MPRVIYEGLDSLVLLWGGWRYLQKKAPRGWSVAGLGSVGRQLGGALRAWSQWLAGQRSRELEEKTGARGCLQGGVGMEEELS